MRESATVKFGPQPLQCLFPIFCLYEVVLRWPKLLANPKELILLSNDRDLYLCRAWINYTHRMLMQAIPILLSWLLAGPALEYVHGDPSIFLCLNHTTESFMHSAI